MMLNRIHLEIIREVDKRGTVTAAAEALCLTQPALSHAIRKLETALGAAIWSREGREVRLTPAGLHLLDVAREILPQLESAERTISEFGQGSRGTLHLGIDCHPCHRWLQTIIAQYLAAWPYVDLDIRQAFQFGGVEALANREIDLLITPDPVNIPSLTFIPVFDYEQKLVVSRTNPLSKYQHVTPEMLSEEVLFTYPVEKDRLDIFSLFLTPAGCRPAVHKTIEDTDIMLQMVDAGRGVTSLPDWLVADYLTRLDVKALRLGMGGVKKQIFVGTRSGLDQTAYIKGFVEIAAG